MVIRPLKDKGLCIVLTHFFSFIKASLFLIDKENNMFIYSLLFTTWTSDSESKDILGGMKC